MAEPRLPWVAVGDPPVVDAPARGAEREGIAPARPRAMVAFLLVLAIALLAPQSAAAAISEFPLPTPQSFPDGITTGPDGALWFTQHGSGLGAGNARIGRITTAGSITQFPIPTSSSLPSAITTGPDGALWFTEDFAGKIGRITTGGTVSEFTVPVAGSRALGIAAGPDSALSFTADNRIGRVTTTGTFTMFPLTGGDAQADASTARASG